ncbi:hypothetical protein REPUB_Repub20aG0012900 [Reevesia pubescens]
MICSYMQMAPNTRLGSRVLLHILLWSLLGAVSICLEEDIRCLKSIKDSLDDPYGYLSSWNFNNNTEGFICRFYGVECWHPDENRVLSIRLANMSLKGQFPRGIEKCRSLTGLDLSNNELSGPIPSNISRIFPYGTFLDLSSNRFSGNIPKQISNCSHLNTLKLDNNQLTGLIPPELAQLNRIETFSVANNQLTGLIPPELAQLNRSVVPLLISSFPFNNKSCYAGNPGLCGFPLEPCIYFKDFFRRGFIIGYMVSVASVLSIFMSYCVPWGHLYKRNKLLRQFMLNPILNRSNKRELSHQTSKMLHIDVPREANRKFS